MVRCPPLLGTWVLVSILHACKSRQPGDVRVQASGVLALAERYGDAVTMRDALEEGIVGPEALEAPLPRTIRVWRRSRDGARTSCDGLVETLPLEDYVKGVLPSEWVASWEPASLEAGAIAIRTYAAFWATMGGKYTCADLDDTTWSQVYGEVRHPRTDAAVEVTAGLVATRDAALVFAEYSAENTATTAHGVEDDICGGSALNGHGRGMCQWGSQRWAEQGWDALRIVEHYYPHAVVGRLEDVRRPDALAARLKRRRAPVRIDAGSTRDLKLYATNTGEEPWPTGSVELRVLAPRSASHGERWLADTVVARNDSRVERGERAVFVAPLASGERDRTERFALFHHDGRRTEATWTLRVLVEPAESVVPWTWVCLGAAAGTLSAGLFLWRKRNSAPPTGVRPP